MSAKTWFAGPERPAFEASGPVLLQESLSGSFHKLFKRISGYSINKRPDQPTQSERNAPRQSHRLTFDENPVRLRFDKPVGVQAP